MTNTFFLKSQFDNNFGKEMASAASVFEQRKKSGMDDYALATYDFVFISNERDNLIRLGEFLTNNYYYKVNSPQNIEDFWELTGDATEFPVDESNLMYWALDLYCKAFEFDCKLDGYGAAGDPSNQKFPIMGVNDGERYFNLAMDAYNKRNLGMAIIHFSTAIKINPNDPNSWYSRAVVKDQLHTWKAARRDYDKAIELAPDFADAIVNRAANKDEAQEYNEAIEDYSLAIGIRPDDEIAYFNRGNSKLNIKDFKGACEDWNKAKELGADYAQTRIDEHCKQKTLHQKAKGFFKW